MTSASKAPVDRRAAWAAYRAAESTTAGDPPSLHYAAEYYGRWLANGTSGCASTDAITVSLEGEMTYGLAYSLLGRRCIWHKRVGVDRVDEVLPRLLKTLEHTAFADELRAAQDIRVGLRALIQRRAPAATLRTEAYRLAAARLLRPDCDAIVQQEIAKALAEPQASPAKPGVNPSRARTHA